MLYPLPSDKYKRTGDNSSRRPERDGRPKEAAAEIHRKCYDSDASSMQSVAGIKATYSDVHWIISSSHSTSRLSSVLQPFITFPTVRVYVCVSISICYLLGFLLHLYCWKIFYFSIVVKVDDI
ncbi:hypothetical protein JOB18_025655 [Solea senegalensis]|uniref:Uncharacterized protein n=1 Tax=Solea senegalensis TaxID=28829 RepID=A0AAV6RUW2_SOLSE|nr:hypothetical protein JOB18_025655 [Solea senegalensis]